MAGAERQAAEQHRPAAMLEAAAILVVAGAAIDLEPGLEAAPQRPACLPGIVAAPALPVLAAELAHGEEVEDVGRGADLRVQHRSRAQDVRRFPRGGALVFDV